MSKLIIVSNRLPITVSPSESGVEFSPSSGGLATGLASVHIARRCQWVGWPGIGSEVIRKRLSEVRRELQSSGCVPVFLTQREAHDYYGGFCNRALWPLFHYFTQNATYDADQWEAYRQVNERFARAIAGVAEPGDTLWIHDYHLMLVPALMRALVPEACIGFFLHIPFPSYEVFRLLPWREEILEGLLGADLVGFHTYDYVGHFLDAVQVVLGRSHDVGDIALDDRTVRADAFPMGIDYERFHHAAESVATEREAARTRNRVGTEKVILSVDRLDYTKGILERLAAFDLFLEQNPEWHERVAMVLLVVPSRIRVQEYQSLKRSIDELIGRVNGRHGHVGWIPLHYMYRSVPFEKLVGLYRAADVALITPLRDGMNLVAKEYVACKGEEGGALVLSEFAGAARELGEALAVNPNNIPGVAHALREALEMPLAEQVRRMQAMQERVAGFHVGRWAEDFVAELAVPRRAPCAPPLLPAAQGTILLADYAAAPHRLILLDYDGTLAPFAPTPGEARPSRRLIALLRNLASNERNEVVLVSGRDRSTLSEWFGRLDVGLAAEHGACIRERGAPWHVTVSRDPSWKERVRPILETYVRRTPGAAIEEKEFSLVWHFRRTEPYASRLRAPELRRILVSLTANLDLQVLDGEHVIEIKAGPYNKGQAAKHWFHKREWGFVLAIGDDLTDEDMFRALPESAYTLKVGRGASWARWRLRTDREVRALLSKLAASGSPGPDPTSR